MPKLIRKDSTTAFDVRPKSRSAISGTMVRSWPTIAPTKALMTISNVNCRQLARSPKTMRLFISPYDRVTGGLPTAITAIQ